MTRIGITTMSDSGSGGKIFLYIAVSIGNLVALSGGIALGWTSPVIPKLQDANKMDENPFGRLLTDAEASWISSILPLGAVFGPLLAGYSSVKFGKKKTLIFCCGIPFVISHLMLAFAENIILYYIARFITGFGMGGTYAVLPNFNSEIAEDSIRGAICSSMNVFTVSGTFFSYALGPYISIMWFNIICAIIPAVFVVLFFLFVPESPYYLVAVNNKRGAAEALKKFRSATDSQVEKELEIIKLSVEEAQRTKGSFLDIFKSKGLVKALIIALSLVGFQQFSGITAVLFNSQTIFEVTGSSIPAEISSMIVGAVQVGSSLITPFVVDRLGRKPLHLISAIGMFIAEVPLGFYFFLKDDKQNIDNFFWLPVVCLVVYITVYNLGFATLPFTVMAEIFPSNIKAAASTATASFSCILAFSIAKFFTTVSDEIGMGGSFWFFSGFCLLAAIFVGTYMIETKGKSFQEIQEILSK